MRGKNNHKYLDKEVLSGQLTNLHTKATKTEDMIKVKAREEYLKEHKIKNYYSFIASFYHGNICNIVNSYGTNLRPYHIDSINSFIDNELKYIEDITSPILIKTDDGEIIRATVVGNCYEDLKNDLKRLKLQNRNKCNKCKTERLSRNILAWGALIISILSLIISLISRDNTEVNLNFPEDFNYQYKMP